MSEAEVPGWGGGRAIVEGSTLVQQLRAEVARLSRRDDTAVLAAVGGLADRLSDLEQLVLDLKADGTVLRDGLAIVADHLERLAPALLAPVAVAVQDLAERISDLPPPDLGPVAAQLARLSATIVSQVRVQPASSAELDQLATRLAAELADTRSLLERGTGSRWRRGAVPADRRDDVEQALQAVDAKLAALADRVDRAVLAVEESTRIAQATLTSAPKAGSTKKAAGAGARAKKATKAPVTRAPAKPEPRPQAD